MSRRVVTLEEVKRRLHEVHGNAVLLDESTFVSASKFARFIDKDYGEWWAGVKGVYEGRRHTQHQWRSSKLGSPSSYEKVAEKLRVKHKDLVTLAPGQTDVRGQSTATFIDCEYGEWTANVSSVINAGHKHPVRAQIEAIKKCRLSTIFKHWKTGKELGCVGGYELAFVNWCNHFRIDFDWQIPFVTAVLTPQGKRSTYYVDAFIKDGEFAGTFIELKGIFRQEVSRQKWEWFHAEHPNSELWTQSRLEELGILLKNKPNSAYAGTSL